jgi:hypothetical protein
MEKKPTRIVDGKPQPQAAHLQELLKLMPDVDREEGRRNVVQPKKDPIRSAPAIALAYTNAATRVIIKIKEEQPEKAICEAAPKDDAICEAAPKDDEQLVALADRHVGKVIWECDEKPYRSYKVIGITTWGPLSKSPQMINGTCAGVERSGKPFPNEFEVPSRCTLGAGKGAIYDPGLLFDLMITSRFKEYIEAHFDEYIEAHRQREGALGMASEDKDAAIDINAAAAAPAPAHKTKGKKRKQMS